MLPKKRRIGRSLFAYITRVGKRYNSPHFLMYTAPMKAEEKPQDSRFSFSLSKKNCKSAVLRNKLRRRGYSVIKDIIINIESGHYFFFNSKKGVEKVGFLELKGEIVKLLSNYTVLK
ncbi:MAG: ribonuclease P protein component [Minisyncoccia bacterium]